MVRNTWPFKGKALCDIIDHKAKWGSSRPQTEVSERYLTASIHLQLHCASVGLRFWCVLLVSRSCALSPPRRRSEVWEALLQNISSVKSKLNAERNELYWNQLSRSTAKAVCMMIKWKEKQARCNRVLIDESWCESPRQARNKKHVSPTCGSDWTGSKMSVTGAVNNFRFIDSKVKVLPLSLSLSLYIYIYIYKQTRH